MTAPTPTPTPKLPHHRRLEDAAPRWRGRRVLVTIDAGLTGPAFEVRLDAAFRSAGSATRVVVSPGSPTPTTVRPIQDAVEAFAPDVIVAIGGGATLDAAKIARVVGPGDSWAAPGGVADATPSLIAVPTTAGTGAETTHFAVLYVDGVKRSIAADGVRPDVAVVDPSFLATVPRSVAASSALDALVQSIESLLSVRSTDESRAAAAAALDLLSGRLPRLDDHDGLGLAAFQAGDAIDRSFTGAAHALSYPFTARAGVPHGVAVARLLPAVIDVIVSAPDERLADPRGARVVRDRLDEIAFALRVAGPKEIPARLRSITDALDAPPLAEIDREIVHAEASPERLANTPVVFDRGLVDRVLDVAIG